MQVKQGAVSLAHLEGFNLIQAAFAQFADNLRAYIAPQAGIGF